MASQKAWLSFIVLPSPPMVWVYCSIGVAYCSIVAFPLYYLSLYFSLYPFPLYNCTL